MARKIKLAYGPEGLGIVDAGIETDITIGVVRPLSHEERERRVAALAAFYDSQPEEGGASPFARSLDGGWKYPQFDPFNLPHQEEGPASAPQTNGPPSLEGDTLWWPEDECGVVWGIHLPTWRKCCEETPQEGATQK